MAKDKIHIVSTALLPVEYLRRLEQQQIEAEVIPFIRTTPSVDEKDLQRIKRWEEREATVVFTSAHGVNAVAEHIDRKVNWRIYCIGGATLDAVIKHFDEDNVIATAPDAKQLVEKMISHVSGSVIFFCGNKRLDIIPREMEAAGITVDEIVVYHTELTPQRVKKNADAVLFFSTSAVESFFEKNTLDKGTVCFAIGNTTADALRKRTDNKIELAENPSKNAMIDLVLKYYHENS